MKKTTYTLMLLMFSIFALSQNKCKGRLLITSNEIISKSADTIFIKNNNIYHNIWSDSLVVKTVNKGKLVFADDKVWGFQESDCTIYRNYNQDFYKVRQIGSLVIYSITRVAGKGLMATTYYFSKSLDAPIFVLKLKNIKEQFKDNSCFLDKVQKDFKWYQDYSNLDKETKSYRIVKSYDECK